MVGKDHEFGLSFSEQDLVLLRPSYCDLRFPRLIVGWLEGVPGSTGKSQKEGQEDPNNAKKHKVTTKQQLKTQLKGPF